MKVSNDEKDLILRLGVGAGAAADGINTFPYLKKRDFPPFRLHHISSEHERR